MFTPTLQYSPQTFRSPDTVYTVQKAALGRAQTRCPIHLGVIMTSRKSYGLGTNIVHLVCPLCVQGSITTNKTTDTDKLQRDLETLSKQYSVLSSSSATTFREINRLHSEIEALKEDLADTMSVDALETDRLDRLISKALPKIEEMIEKAESERDPPTSIEQIQELHANMMELEKKIKSVSDSAQQVVSDALHDVLQQINEVATRSNKSDFATDCDAQAFRMEMDKVKSGLVAVQRTMETLPARVSRNEQQIHTVLSNLASMEVRMDRMTQRYDRQFADMDQRVSILEYALHSSPVVQSKVVSDGKIDGRYRNPGSEELQVPLDILKLQNDVDKPNLQNSQTHSTLNQTTSHEAEEFLWISNQEPLSTFLEDDSKLGTDFLQLVNNDKVKILDIFLTVSESPDLSEKLSRFITKMKENPGSVEIQLNGCVALMLCFWTVLNLKSIAPAMAFAKSIAKLDGVSLQIATLYRHQSNDRILYFSLENLGIMAFLSKSMALAIDSENCLDFALSTIRKRIDGSGNADGNDREIIDSCIGLLNFTSMHSPAIRHSLIAQNAVETVALVKNLHGLSKRIDKYLNSLSKMLERPDDCWVAVQK